MIFEIIILLAGIPLGYLVAYFTRDEIVSGRKWFLSVIVIFTLTLIFSLVIGREVLSFTLGFGILFTGVCYWKSFDYGFVKIPFKDSV